MITLFEEYSSKDYTEVELYKMGIPMTYSNFNRQGDKEFKWRFEATQIIKKLFTNKVITIEDENLTDLVENVSTYDDVDLPMLRMKFARFPKWRTVNQTKPFKIWNDDSETAKQIKLEVKAKKYNL